VHAKNTELLELTKLVEALRQEESSNLSELLKEKKSLEDELTEASTRLEFLTGEQVVYQQDLDEANARVTELTLKEASLKNELAELNERLTIEIGAKNIQLLELNKLVDSLRPQEKCDTGVSNQTEAPEPLQTKAEPISKGKRPGKKSKTASADNKMTSEPRDSIETDKKLAEANTELANLNEVLAACQQNLTEANLKVDVLTTSEATLKEELVSASQVLAACQQNLTEANLKVDFLTTSEASLKEELARFNERITIDREALTTCQQELKESVQRMEALVCSENALKDDLNSALVQIKVLMSSESSLKEELETLNKKYDSLKVKVQAVKSKKSKKPETVEVEISAKTEPEAEHNLQQELDLARQQCVATTEQLARYEASFGEVQEERDALQGELDELKLRLTGLEATRSECVELKKAKEEVEELNLKYKTKLKQLLKQKQLQQQLKSHLTPSGSLTPCSIQIPEEVVGYGRSMNGSPLSFSPSVQSASAGTVTGECQTELGWEEIEILGRELAEERRRRDEEKDRYEARLVEITAVNEELSARLEQEKQQHTQQPGEDLNGRIETLQQQNHKLKVNNCLFLLQEFTPSEDSLSRIH